MDAGDLRRLFDEAEQDMDFESGSIEAVKERALERQNRSRSLRGLLALLLVLAIGFFAYQVFFTEPVALPGANESSDDWVTNGLLGEDDFSYVGSFLVPADVGDPGLAFGGHSIAYNPAGDGSLFITGLAVNEQVAEISIPIARPHEGLADNLFTADLLQPLSDITDGRGSELIGSTTLGGADDFRIGDLEVFDGRLHWTAYMPQNVGPHDVPGHGHSSLDLANPDTEGPWFLDEFLTLKTAGYLFDVPPAFATEHLDGRPLVSGAQLGVDSSAASSWGPPFYAYEPPDGADPSTRLDAIELSNYDYPDRVLEGFDAGQSLRGVDWVTTADGRNAVVGVGNNSLLGSTPCRSEGTNDIEAFGPRVVMYDPNDLALAASGVLAPWEVEPYETFDFSDDLIPICGGELAAMAYDEANSRLFVVQVNADNFQDESLFLPVVHVVRVG